MKMHALTGQLCYCCILAAACVIQATWIKVINPCTGIAGVECFPEEMSAYNAFIYSAD